jgi:2-dehydropantoate 2-reductase
MSLSVGIIGVGGVGGYFGSKFCRVMHTQGIQVYFVTRGAHLEQIRQHGLAIKTASEGEWACHPTLATDRIQDLPLLDICLICVKSYDLSKVVQQLKEKVYGTTAILPLLNGIDIYERIRADMDIAHVFPGCVYIGTHIKSPGRIVQQGGSCKILLGTDPLAIRIVPRRLLELFDRSSVKYEWMDDVNPALWTKFVFIAAYGLVGAGFDKNLGQILDSAQLSEYVQQVMREVVALAEKKGIGLPLGIIDESYKKGRDFPYDTKTSFQRDFETAGKPDERDLFGSAILRIGKQLGVETPATQELWEILNKRKP